MATIQSTQDNKTLCQSDAQQTHPPAPVSNPEPPSKPTTDSSIQGSPDTTLGPAWTPPSKNRNYTKSTQKPDGPFFQALATEKDVSLSGNRASKRVSLSGIPRVSHGPVSSACGLPAKLRFPPGLSISVSAVLRKKNLQSCWPACWLARRSTCLRSTRLHVIG